MLWSMQLKHTHLQVKINPISKMLSIEALKLLGGSIEKAVFEGSNVEARGNMLIGAMLAGKAFAILQLQQSMLLHIRLVELFMFLTDFQILGVTICPKVQ